MRSIYLFGLESDPSRTPQTRTNRRLENEACTIQVKKPVDEPIQPLRQNDILVIGALAVDTSCDYTPLEAVEEPSPEKGVSNPARTVQTAGGVGRNVATAAQYAGAQVALASVVADDLAGDMLKRSLRRDGLDTSSMLTQEKSATAQYIAINDLNKDLVFGMADFGIFDQVQVGKSDHWSNIIQSSQPKWIVLDANWSRETISQVLIVAKAQSIPVAFEPVSAAKCGRLFSKVPVVPRNIVSLATPNMYELRAMHRSATDFEWMQSEMWWEIIDSFGLSSAGSRDKFMALGYPEIVEKGVPQQVVRLLPFIPNIIVNLGSRGSLLAMVLRRGDPKLSDVETAPYILSRTAYEAGDIGGVYMRLFAPPEVLPAADIVSVNGGGDTMLGVLVAALAKSGKSLEELVPMAQRAAALTLKSKESVSPAIKEAGFI